MYFYNTLSHKNKIHFVEKVGISGTAINTSRDIEVNVDELIIYNCNGEEMIHYSSKNKLDNDISEVYRRLVFHKGEQLNSKFIEIVLSQTKILIFFKCELNVICIFKECIQSSVVKFYIKFIVNAFCNFIGQSVFSKNFNCDWKYICKIFEVFFVPYLNKKFFSVIYQISNVEEYFGKEQEKLKNILIVDTNTRAILYNFRKTVKKKKIINYALKKEIWDNLQLHISITRQDTKTKMDLMSTYPRLRFTTQIFAITPNIVVNEANFALIAIYSINKLSRNSHKYFEHEVSTLNTNESSSNYIINNFVVFLYEYFSSIEKSSSLYYFDIDMLVIIDEGLYSKMSFENFIIFLKKKLQNMLIAKAKDIENNYQKALSIENILKVNKEMIYCSLYSYKKKSCDFLSGVSLDKSMHSEELSRQVSLIPKNFDTTGFVSPSDLVGVNEISDEMDEDTKYYSSNNFKQANKDTSPKSAYSTGVRKDKVSIIKDIQFKLVNYDNNGIAFNEYKLREFSSNDNSPNGRIKKIQSAQVALFSRKLNSNKKKDNEEEHFEGYKINVNSESDDSHDKDDGSQGVFIREGNKLTNNLLEFYGDKKGSSNQASPRSPHFYHFSEGHDTL